MPRTTATRREDALAIWRAGVDAVRAERLMRDHLRVEDDAFWIDDDAIPLGDVRRIAVVGAGKAGAGMAAGLEEILGEELLAAKSVQGIVSVPENCVRPLARVELRAGRPAGVNAPTEDGVRIADEILQIAARLEPDDLCVCLLSGGGSALLPAPAGGVSLAEKQFLTQELAARGADIEALNTARKQLSRIKGGGLARACRARRLVSLIISDVLGDRLDIIASGPTVDDASTPVAALEVLDNFHLLDAPEAAGAIRYLRERAERPPQSAVAHGGENTIARSHYVLGSNAVAVDAAGQEAVRRGYRPALISAGASEGSAESVAQHIAQMALRMRDNPGPNCLISGGEPTVTLADAAERGIGGRNQQLVLAAMETLGDARGVTLLSGGTDGEDGPTDAAGAVIDESLTAAAHAHGLDPTTHLQKNDAYHFFEPIGGLIQIGPTNTNVCDIRVVVVEQGEVVEN